MERILHMSVGDSNFGEVVRVRKALVAPRIIVVCEHASNHFPKLTQGLGLTAGLRKSHIAWDPGARQVAEFLADDLEADLVLGCVSRLIYDCNRPPDAPDAVAPRSETYDIPGNINLSEEDRTERVNSVYVPFRDTLAQAISNRRHSLELLITLHSFTPVFHSKRRDVEIGILHGEDAAFAKAMLAQAFVASDFDVRLNEPYGPDSGVSHTLDAHGATNKLPSVMIEIRNDLITNAAEQRGMANLLAEWVRVTLSQFNQGNAA